MEFPGWTRLSPFRRDVACACALTVACLALWLPVLDVVSLNPDESQYEATASYLVAQGETAFLPNGSPGTFLLFKVMTLLAGPYPIFAVRVSTQLVALILAFVLFLVVARETDRGCGLLSGLTFLHLVVRYEGFAVNREWFASFCTVTGIGLALWILADDRRDRRWVWFAAGLLCGGALWFKLQVAWIVFVIPLVLIQDAFARRSTGRLRGALPAFALGGIGAGVAYLAPFAWHGTLSEFLGYVFADMAVFVEGNEAVREADYVGRFYGTIPYGVLFAVGYVFAAGVLAQCSLAAWRGRGNDGRFGRPALVAFAIYLALSVYSVQMGQRFFAHYYQLMIPALAACLGLAVFAFRHWTRERPAWRGVALAATVFFLVDRFLELRGSALWSGKFRWPLEWVAALLTIGCLLVAAYWLLHPWRRAGAAIAALIVVQSTVLVVTEQLAPAPVSMQHNPHKFSELSASLRRQAQPGDRLFVWGWAPEIYSLSRIEAASHIAFCQYVANDLLGVPDRPRLNDRWAEMLMEELEATRPRFIVDAAEASWFETEETIYRLDNFPEFELNALLRERYRVLARLDGCTVWERIEPPRPSP